MEHLKKYDEFVNEEIDWGRIGRTTSNIFLTILFSSVALIYLILVLPREIFMALYYCYGSGDWEMFARSIETSMDILYSYSYYISQIEDSDNQLREKDKKRIEKIRRLMIKKFGKDSPTEEQIKDYIKGKLIKISKGKDIERINDLIDNYTLRKDLSNKKVKMIRSLVELLNVKDDPELKIIDPFGEEDWEDEQVESDLPLDFDDDYYYMSLYPVQVGISKAVPTIYGDDGYHIGELYIKKDELIHIYQKYLKFRADPLRKYFHSKRGGYDKNLTVVLPLNQRDVFIEILKDNWNVILNLYKKSLKGLNPDRFYAQVKQKMYEKLKTMNPEELVDMLDEIKRIRTYVDISNPSWLADPAEGPRRPLPINPGGGGGWFL